MRGAFVSDLVGLGLLVLGVGVANLNRTSAANGATLLAVLLIIAAFVVVIVGNERARKLRRLILPRGSYRLEQIGDVVNGAPRWVFGNDEQHRAVPVRSDDDLQALILFMDGRALYVIDPAKRDVIRRYLEELSAGVTA